MFNSRQFNQVVYNHTNNVKKFLSPALALASKKTLGRVLSKILGVLAKTPSFSTRVETFVIAISLKFVSIAKKISKAPITTAKIGDLAKSLSRNSVIARLISAAKIGILALAPLKLARIKRLVSPSIGLKSILAHIETFLISVTKTLGIKALSLGRQTIIARAITAAKIGNLAKSLVRNFIFVRLITAAKIGLLYISIKKAISKIYFAPKLGLLATLKRLEIDVYVLVAKIGLLSTIKRALVFARKINPNLGLLSSIKKAVRALRSILPKIGLLSTLIRLEVDVYKLTALLGAKVLSFGRHSVIARLISTVKIGLKATRYIGVFLKTKLGIRIPRIGAFIFGVAIGIVSSIWKIASRIRLLSPKLGLLASSLSKRAITSRILSAKDGLKSVLSRLSVYIISLSAKVGGKVLIIRKDIKRFLSAVKFGLLSSLVATGKTSVTFISKIGEHIVLTRLYSSIRKVTVLLGLHITLNKSVIYLISISAKIGTKVISIIKSISKVAFNPKLGDKALSMSRSVGKYISAKIGDKILSLARGAGRTIKPKLGLLSSATKKLIGKRILSATDGLHSAIVELGVYLERLTILLEVLKDKISRRSSANFSS